MKETTIFKGIIFDLVRAEFDGGDHTIVRDVIRHPGGVGILVIDQGKVLLVSQPRQAIGKQTWEIPAGKLEYGENPKECGIRELNEETGYECSSFDYFTSFYSTPGFCDEKIYLFQAKDPTPVKNKLDQDKDENITHQWFDLDKAIEMIQEGIIDDAKTMIALQHALIERMK